MKISFWPIVFGYWFLAIIIVVYSYSQIDLNLTLSSNSLYQTFQQKMIQLGYFNRSLSAFIYLTLIILLFANYYLLITLTKKGKLRLSQIWLLILVAGGIFLFSYPAFSHDIFNYIFDVRILLYHKANPWMYTALDFPIDPWTRFMHWTHRTYPYGPFWIIASIIPYALGFGKFVLTLFNFKLLLSFSYLGSCYLVYKISQSFKQEMAMINLSLFAFNPLVLNESLISPHLDIFMVFLGLLAIYLIVSKRTLLGGFFLALSILTKYATVGYIPIMMPKMKIQKKIFWMFGLTLLAILGQISIREVLPWYFLPLIGVAVLSTSKTIRAVIVGLSLGGILFYLPFIYFGEYSQLVKNLRLFLFFLPIIMSFLWIKIVKTKK